MRRLLLILLTLSLPAASAHAGEWSVRSVRAAGSGVLTGEEIVEQLQIDRSGDWTAGAESLAVAGLLDRLARLGHLKAEVDVRAREAGEGMVDLEVVVRDGPRYTVDRVDLEGAEAIVPDEALSRFDTTPGKVLDADRLERDLDRLLRRYAKNGYPFARLLLAGVTLDGGVGIDLRVVEGPELTLGEMRVTGNSTTRPGTIRRLSGLRFNRPYDQESVEASRRRLLGSGLFRTVSEPAVRIDWQSKEAVVEIEVEEAKASRIFGVVGYAPGGSGEDPVLSGLVDVSFRNILGTARSGGAHWERVSPESREVRLFYREPWVFGTPFAVGGEFEQSLRDSNYSRLSGDLTVDVDLSRRVTATFSGGRESMRPRGETSPVPHSTRSRGGVAFLFDGRDVPDNPSRGVRLRLGGEYGERKIDEELERGIEGEKIRQATLEGGVGIYHGIRSRSVAALELGGKGRFTDAEYVPAYDQFYLGGARTLRGYDEDRFRGSRLAWSRLEYRYLFGVLSRVFLFVDTGYIFSRREEAGTVVRSETVKHGYGFGIRFESAIGVVGVDLGLGEGDRFGEGKLHVSAEGDF